MRRAPAEILLLLFSLLLILGTAVGAFGSEHDDQFSYFPFVARAEPTPTPSPTPTPTPTPTATPRPAGMVEFRGLWITRFNLTLGVDPSQQPALLDRMVDDAAQAGFNALLFQVRGEADAFYTPGLEPWSARLSGALGQNPGWDPLARIVQRAHDKGLQVHAYINVYPVWGCGDPPPSTNPQHLYHLLAARGVTNGKVNELQWTTDNVVHCSGYRRATPASVFLDEHLMAVARDIIQRYDVDGLHLDHIRYGGSNTSCDPVSQTRSGVLCFTAAPEGYASYGDWQRAQVNGTVGKYYDTLFGEQGVADKPGLMLSGAVWPYYDSGYYSYYQASKEWLAGAYIDAIMPMLYGSFDTSPDVWRSYAAGFQAANAGRFVIPGIHGRYFAGQDGTFQDVADRIQAARDLGTAGHAIFAYNYLAEKGFFDDLAAGPYATPAVPPTIGWHD